MVPSLRGPPPPRAEGGALWQTGRCWKLGIGPGMVNHRRHGGQEQEGSKLVLWSNQELVGCTVGRVCQAGPGP